MFPYILTFIFSCLLIFSSCKIKNKILKKILLWLGLLAPCFLAGFRAETIGTDVQVYVQPMYEAAAKSGNLLEYFQFGWKLPWGPTQVKDYEIGYTLLVYLVTKIFGSLSAVLFFLHLLIILPVYKAIEHFSTKLSPWFALLTFYTLNFNVSLNMMRQWIAMAILLFGFRYVVDKKIWKYLICVLVAMAFHVSSIIGILVYFLYNYIANNKIKTRSINLHFGKKKITIDSSIYKLVFITIVGLFILAALSLIARLFEMLGLTRFVGYISGTIYLAPNQILLRLPIILIFILFYRNLLKRDPITPFWLSAMIIDLILSQLVSINEFSFRISVYFSQYSMLSIPIMVRCSCAKRSRKLLLGVIVIGYLCFYWWFYFVFKGVHQTMPYVPIWG